MAIQVKALTNGTPTIDNSLVSPNDSFNVIPAATAAAIYDLYTVPVGKTCVVKNIRLTNITAAPVTTNLYFTRFTIGGLARRRQLTPVDMVIPAGILYIDDDEITLEAGDRIQAKASAPNGVQYMISGVERDI